MREQFNSTYKNLLDSLNEKKKAGIKYDFAADLRIYERDFEIDTICFFRVRSWKLLSYRSFDAEYPVFSALRFLLIANAVSSCTPLSCSVPCVPVFLRPN